MRAGILAIGDELMEGRVDTNSVWLAEALDRIGWRVIEKRQCRDDVAAIVRHLDELTGQVDLIVTTGGLGPTTDDLTTDAVCRWAGAEQELHAETWAHIQQRFKERGYPLPPTNIKQAYFPRGGTPLFNRYGTAMGYLTEKGPTLAASFPGVPREMKGMVEDELLPALVRRFPRASYRVVRKLKIFGHTESGVNQLMQGIAAGVEGVEIAYLVSFPEVSLFFKVTRPSEAEAAEVAGRLAAEARRRLGDKCYGEGDATLEGALGEACTKLGVTIATAESCTAGLVAALITEVPGSSAYFTAGLATYSNAAKQRHLGVRAETLKAFGAVSAETCEEMLAGLLATSGAGAGIAITGIAGPTGGTPEKPVGLVYIAWGDGDGAEVREFRFGGTRGDVRRLTAFTAIDLLRRFLLAKTAAA
jgi:nicotinamide-nucleotide amidase